MLDTHLQVVLPPIPFERCSEELAVKRNIIVSAETFLITAQDDLVLSSILNADSVICVTVCWVQVENE